MLEKDLETLLSENLLHVLFEEAPLMPIFQERPAQSEADIYALNQFGDLIIFELKVGLAGAGAVNQILYYAQEAGKWTFEELNRKYKLYSESKNDILKPLIEAHKEDFELESPLLQSQFNLKQHLWIIANAADDGLIRAVDYWKRQGLSIDFIPYRVYRIGNDEYFEFFSLPYDKHPNPALTKGVMFDTNRANNKDSIWDMMENSKVAAWGSVRHVVERLRPKDIVFFSHKWDGIVAAAKVIGRVVSVEENEEKYYNVEFLTPIPSRDKEIKFMPFSQVKQILGKNFYWATTIKTPKLSYDEAELLLTELNRILSG